MALLPLKDRVDTESLSYKRQAERWILLDDLESTQNMRDAGARRLPPEEKEKTPKWKRRNAAAVLFPSYKETVDTAASRPYAKPVTLQEGDSLPDRLQQIETNADLAENSLTQFMRGLDRDGWKYGRHHYFVEFPNTEATKNLRDEQESGVRPYFVRFCPRDIIRAKMKRAVDGRQYLAELAVREEGVEDDGAYGEKETTSIRVYKDDGKGNASWEIWTKDDRARDFAGRFASNNYEMTDSGTLSLGYIPLVSTYFDYVGPFESNPPFEGLAFVNERHYRLDSDVQNSLRIALVPMLTAIGLKPEEYDGGIEIGTSGLLKSTNTDARFSYTEHSGAAIGSGMNMLKALEERMESLGQAPMTVRTVAITATERGIDETKSSTDAEACARVTEQSILRGFEIAAELVKQELPEDFKADLAEFGTSNRGVEDMATVLQMKTAGTITSKLVNIEAKRRGILGEQVDPEQEAKDAANEVPLGLLTSGGFGRFGGRPEEEEEEETPTATETKDATGSGAGEAA